MESMRKRSRTEIDWGRVKQRLAAAEEALARGDAPSAEAQRAILRARAQIAMQVPVDMAGAADEIEVIVFRLANEFYALESAWVHEVLPLKDLTPLPCTPPFVLGVIQIHGRILSVIDLKRFFDLPDTGLTNLSNVLILRQDETEFGILADQITGVDHLRSEGLQAPIATMTEKRAEYLKGVTAEGLVVLDAPRLLASSALIVEQEIPS